MVLLKVVFQYSVPKTRDTSWLSCGFRTNKSTCKILFIFSETSPVTTSTEIMISNYFEVSWNVSKMNFVHFNWVFFPLRWLIYSQYKRNRVLVIFPVECLRRARATGRLIKINLLSYSLLVWPEHYYLKYVVQIAISNAK